MDCSLLQSGQNGGPERRMRVCLPTFAGDLTGDPTDGRLAAPRFTALFLSAKRGLHPGR